MLTFMSNELTTLLDNKFGPINIPYLSLVVLHLDKWELPSRLEVYKTINNNEIS